MKRIDSPRDVGRPGRIDGRLAFILLAFAIALAGRPAFSTPPSFTEDFSTTTFRDAANTTADWNTLAGELKLFPFVPGVVGSADTPGSAVRVVVEGDVAYVADESGGLRVIDISDPTAPVVIGSYTIPAVVSGLFADGDYLYLAAEADGLLVIDISDPSSPSLAGSYNTTGLSTDVFVSGDYAYVADWAGGLRVIDISDPTTPVLVATFATGAARYVYVDGDHAYVADWTSKLVIVDISNPAAPSLAANYTTTAVPQGVFVSGNRAYVSAGRLLILDVSDPTAPVLLGSQTTPAFSRDIFVDGERAYVSDASFGVYAIDVGDPTAPVLEASYSTPDGGWDVVVSGDHAFVASAGSGLQVVRVSNILTIPIPAATVGSSGGAWAVTAWGQYILEGDGSTGIRIFDVGDPTNPVLVGTYDTPGSASVIDVSGHHAYVADRNGGLQIVDISDPTTPTLVGSFGTSDVYSVVVSGDYAYLGGFAFQVVDISDPTTPSLVGSLSTPVLIENLEVAGDHAYAAGYGMSVNVIDISNPASPAVIAYLPHSGEASGVAIAGDLAFVAGDPGLEMIDISDPTSPTLIGSFALGGPAFRVAVSGDHALVAALAGGLQVIDISDPTDPVFTGSYRPFVTGVVGVAPFGEVAYIVDLYRGVMEAIHLRQRDVTPSTGFGQSIPVDGENHEIPRARLSAVQTPGIYWEVGDFASGVTPILANGDWTRLGSPGPDLVFRAKLYWQPGTVAPEVTELTLDWLNGHGRITSITDVPGDQGGFVRLRFDRSGYDFADETALPITGYQIYQRVDDAAFQAELDRAGVVPASGKPRLIGALAGLDPAGVRLLGDRTFILGRELGPAGTFPPGIWEAVTWVAATQRDEYLARVSTTSDSTASGVNWSVYLVTAHTSTPSVWYACPPDSGYSLDNIAPAVPGGLTFTGPGILQWSLAPEEDFAHHSVYGSASPTFDMTAVLIGHTTDPTLNVSASPFAVYHVTTSDHAGNESGAASISNTVGVPGEPLLPVAFAMHAAQPNPFRAGTSIGFDLPSTETVQLVIFDAAGRRVRELAHDGYEAGRHRIPWDGTDESGSAVSAGVYFVRLTAGAFAASGRLVTLR